MTDTSKETRKGIKIYLDYFDCEFEDLTDEQVGQLLRGLYEYDKFGEPQKYKEVINSERVVRTVFKTMCKNHDRAVASWERKRNYWKNKKGNKSNNEDEEDIPEEETNSTLTKEYTIQFETFTNTFEVIYDKKYKKNIPTAKELQESYANELDENQANYEIEILLENGNKDGWQKEWYEYSSKIPD